MEEKVNFIFATVIKNVIPLNKSINFITVNCPPHVI